jgi:protein phosphatase 1L
MKKIFLIITLLAFRLQNIFGMFHELKFLDFYKIAAIQQQINSETQLASQFNNSTAKYDKVKITIETETKDKILSISYTQGYRPSMQDTFDFRIDKDKKFACFGIFDGHGGKDVSEYLEKNLFNNILKSTEKDIKLKIKNTFLETNNNIQTNFTGSTAITVFFYEDKLFIANVGDSRTIISKKKLAVALSDDHTYKNKAEKYRILKSGGFFNSSNRVCGSLIPTRAFGDLYLKKYIIAEPDIFTLTLNEDYEYLILACDGLWDAVENQEAVDLISGKETIDDMSLVLVREALKKGSSDNITVIVINLKELKKVLNNHE